MCSLAQNRQIFKFLLGSAFTQNEPILFQFKFLYSRAYKTKKHLKSFQDFYESNLQVFGV